MLKASVLPLVMTGGTILRGTYLNSAFHRACETLGLMFAEIRHVPEPAEGAVQLAKKITSI
jgi:hypothetical protein